MIDLVWRYRYTTCWVIYVGYVAVVFRAFEAIR